MDLLRRSIETILRNQSPSGAYVACPTFPHYRYCWFRDGSFIAAAMDRSGEHGSAARFHGWAARAINARAETVSRAVEKARRGEPPGNDVLHTRYDSDGKESTEAWANFQLDGFGSWLWALDEHRRRSEAPLPDEWRSAARLAADYLTALWRFPCYDCWEEFPDAVHSYTLAAVYGGLRAHEEVEGVAHEVLPGIKEFIFALAEGRGCFIKAEGMPEVDASLIGLATPYRVVAPDHPLMAATLGRIERELRRGGGGLHRYPEDSYYGGGEWVHLAAWLGWHYAERGERGRALELKAWVEEQADEEGSLPEQVPRTLIAPGAYPEWRRRWGEIARPLLWGHAQYLILAHALDQAM